MRDLYRYCTNEIKESADDLTICLSIYKDSNNDNDLFVEIDKYTDTYYMCFYKLDDQCTQYLKTLIQ